MNQPLREKLLAMQQADQRLLHRLIDAGEIGEEAYHPAMKALHEKHNSLFKHIIAEYGWPGISMVGKEGAKAAWLIVQHAVLDPDLMQNALQLLKQAVERGDAESWCMAYLQDRVLTLSGKPQIYGTQHDFDMFGRAHPLPIDDPENVDTRRKAIGLGPLSEATRRIQQQYRHGS